MLITKLHAYNFQSYLSRDWSERTVHPVINGGLIEKPYCMNSSYESTLFKVGL